MLNVFITVDTDVWPRRPDWRANGLAEDLRRDFDGVTPEGEFGVPFQIGVFNSFRLKATFFVEGLHASAAGVAPLRRMGALIRERGQDVQLHLHPEWLRYAAAPDLPPYRGDNLKAYSQAEQARLLGRALVNFSEAGIPRPMAFRAGNYGADFRTLAALSQLGIPFDTSYNYWYVGGDCGLEFPQPLLQPRTVSGVVEFPITIFRDWPRHHRPAQLCACSSAELENALLQAWRRGWYAFILVSHGFELIKNHRQVRTPPRPDWHVIRRFVRLCQFLDQHRDKFRTCWFADVDVTEVPAAAVRQPLRSRIQYTGGRFVEQFIRRIPFKSPVPAAVARFGGPSAAGDAASSVRASPRP